MNGYELSRNWFDFCFENPEKIKPNHSALYFFIVEHCNRLGWKEKFGLPTTMAKDAIGIKNYKTYINTLNDIVDWGFVKLIEKSKNQYSSNIVALVNFTKADGKALDKAILKHDTKQPQSIDSIDKPLTNNQELFIDTSWKSNLLKLHKITVVEYNKHLNNFVATEDMEREWKEVHLHWKRYLNKVDKETNEPIKFNPYG